MFTKIGSSVSRQFLKTQAGTGVQVARFNISAPNYPRQETIPDGFEGVKLRVADSVILERVNWKRTVWRNAAVDLANFLVEKCRKFIG